MSTLTVFGNYSKKQHQMARLEDYSRAINHLENSIVKVKENYQNGLDYIKKLEADRKTTSDELQLRQIDVDLNYLRQHFDPTEMNQKISSLETKLKNHRIRLKKLYEKNEVKKTPATADA